MLLIIEWTGATTATILIQVASSFDSIKDEFNEAEVESMKKKVSQGCKIKKRNRYATTVNGDKNIARIEDTFRMKC